MRKTSDYKPYKGFYDLREYNLSRKDFIKLWNIQEYLFHIEKNKKYFMKYDKSMFEDAKELSGNYQQILFGIGL